MTQRAHTSEGYEFYTHKSVEILVSSRKMMDNLSSHKVAGVKEMIESAEAKLLYLPPFR